MQLSFNYTFEFAGDEVFCCYTIPYTYSEMQKHLDQIHMLSLKESKTQILRMDSIGKSIGGLNIPIIKISSKKFLPVVMIIGR